MPTYLNYPIRIIERTKLSGVGKHLGVQISENLVVHNTPESGPRVVSLAEFSQGRHVKEIKRASPAQYREIIKRVIESTSNPSKYHLLDWNCESLATWLLGEKPHSPQIFGIFLFAGAMLSLKFLA